MNHARLPDESQEQYRRRQKLFKIWRRNYLRGIYISGPMTGQFVPVVTKENPDTLSAFGTLTNLLKRAFGQSG